MGGSLPICLGRSPNMRPYVSKIDSNFKGGCTAELGRKTLIVGPSWSGKSRIVNAIEAAGSAKVSDVAGRALLAKGAELSVLADGDTAFANARLDDGTALDFSVERGHNPKRTGPEIAFPLREARAAILGSPETARKWVLEVAGEMTWGEVVALVPASLAERLAKIPLGSFSDTYKASDALVSALEGARRHVREANASARAARSISAPPGPPPSDDEIARLEGIVKGWEARGAGGAIDTVREALATARGNTDRLAAAVQAHEAELAGLQTLAPTSKLRESAVEVAEAVANAKLTSCPICGCGCDPVIVAGRAAGARKKIQADAAKGKRRLDLEFALREANADLGASRREVARLEAEATKLARLGGDGKALGEPLPMSKEAAETELRSLRDRRAGWAATRRMEEQALVAEREATEWGQLAEALSKAMGTLVEKARSGFEAKVQRFLPSSMVFGIDLLDGDREVLRVGLRESVGGPLCAQVAMGPSHIALSGAQWVIITAALALATAPEKGPCIVVPEDRAIDADNLVKVLEVWGSVLASDDAPQIVMTSTVTPSMIPAGWTVVWTDARYKAAPIIESQTLAAPPATNVPRPPQFAGPTIVTSGLPGGETVVVPAPKRRGRPPKAKPNGDPAATPAPTTKPEVVAEFFPSKVNEDGTKSFVEKPVLTEAQRKALDDIFGE